LAAEAEKARARAPALVSPLKRLSFYVVALRPD
jgi:hypothetical protein